MVVNLSHSFYSLQSEIIPDVSGSMVESTNLARCLFVYNATVLSLTCVENYGFTVFAWNESAKAVPEMRWHYIQRNYIFIYLLFIRLLFQPYFYK